MTISDIIWDAPEDLNIDFPDEVEVPDGMSTEEAMAWFEQNSFDTYGFAAKTFTINE